MALVYDPASGQIVTVADNNPAALMTAQAKIPVIGPRGPMLNGELVPAPAPVPTQPYSGRPGIAPFEGEQTPVDPWARRQGGVGLLGVRGNVTIPGEGGPHGGGAISLPPMASLIPRFDFSATQAQPLATPVSPAAAPVAPPVASGVPPAAPVVPARAAVDLAGTNAALAQGLTALRPPPPAPVAERGVYNAQNTPRGSGAPVNNGINFGYGVNGAPSVQQMTDRFDQQDRQARLDRRADSDRRVYDALASTLGDRDASTADKRIILKQMEMSQNFGITGADRAQGQAGGLLGAQVTRETEVSKYAAAVAAAQAAAQGQLNVANTTGQYGVQAATIKADGTRATAAATLRNGEGANRNNNAEADRMERLVAYVDDLQAHGEITPQQGVEMLKTGQVPAGYVPRDAITGATFTTGPGGTLGMQQEVTKRNLQKQLTR